MKNLIVLSILLAFVVGSNAAWCEKAGRWYQTSSKVYRISSQWCQCTSSGQMKCGLCSIFGQVLDVGTTTIGTKACTCARNGAVSCEQATAKRAQSTCEVDGKFYQVGKHNIGDMECICDADGQLACEYKEKPADAAKFKKLLEILQNKNE